MKKYQVNFLHLHVNGASNSKLTKFTLITYVDHHEKYRYILLNNVSSRIKKKVYLSIKSLKIQKILITFLIHVI